MKAWYATLLLVITLTASTVESWSVQIANADPVVRHGLIWRCRITGEIPTERFAQGPYLAQVSLTQGSSTLAAQEFPLAHLGQLRGGLDVVLVPSQAPAAEEEVTLAVTVSDPTRRDLQLAKRSLPTPLSLQRGLEQRQRTLQQRPDNDPLPALWLEQAGELMLGSSSIATCTQLQDITRRLDRWLAGTREPGALLALRDPLDGSVQPYRLHLPDTGTATALAVLLLDPPGDLHKSAWPSAPPAWLASARSAGVAVVEVYPAGDRTMSGVARTRTWTTIEAVYASIPALRPLPLLLIGGGRAGAGAIALAEDQPWRWRGLGIIDGRLPQAQALPNEPHLRWLALQRPGERPAHLLHLNVAVAGAGDQATTSWSERLRLAGHPTLLPSTNPASADFWQHLCHSVPSSGALEWVVLSPGRYGGLRVDELADWGIAGFLREDGNGNLKTVGISRLVDESSALRMLNGVPYHPSVAVDAPPRKAFGQATGPLAGYAQGPFTVVLGTVESLAARTDNHALGAAFAAAWAAHAHGRVRLVEDTTIADDGPVGHHLVLIGNTRSNQVLARLALRTALPVQWDARSVSVGGESYLRAEHRALALCWPHPANDGRLLVILDGNASWKTDGLPLAGLGDLFVAGATAEAPPALERTFTNAWR